jgi:hypothetical protein
MKTKSPLNSSSGKFGLRIAVLLAILLGILFWRSFLPGYVHFSNDGPLGQQNVNWIHLPSAIFGMWDDLNDIGLNTGAYPATATMLLRWMLGPVGFAKFYAPCALFILGIGALCFFRALKLGSLAVCLGALATMLNSTYVGGACWGVATAELAIGFNFMALALVLTNHVKTPWHVYLLRLALAGLCVGINVMEAADIGALCSILVALFIFYKSLVENASDLPGGIIRGFGRVAIVTIFALFIAAQSVVTLIGSSITGIAGTAQNDQAKAAHWNFATQWSLPKTETLGLFVPGLFGYKMDTPDGMMPLVKKYYEGGQYWGGVGRDPLLDEYLDSHPDGSLPPSNFMRFTGGGNFCGILVTLVALWGIAQSFQKKNPVFSREQRLILWFWTVVLAGSLLLAWGRFSIFYWVPYHLLPYFSTIRNPTKFLIFFSWALLLGFAYGVDALSRRYLTLTGVPGSLSKWWASASVFDRRWTYACGGVLAVSVVGCLVLAADQSAFIHYLQQRGFPGDITAPAIAAFSLSQLEWFVVLAAIAMGLLILVVAGYFSGKRARLGIALLGIFMVFDLGRADLPYIVHWNYIRKYDLDPADSSRSINPVINFLQDKTYEQRVAVLPYEPQQPLPGNDAYFGDLYRIEWAQHHFPYYNIQSLDLIQMPRMPVNSEAYQVALLPNRTPESALRRWELTNTRYLLGAAGFVDALNQQLDPARHRFRIAQRFDLVVKPDADTEHMGLEDLTAVTNDNGNLAVLDFTGALPRAKLYSNWEVAKGNPAELESWVTNLQSRLPAQMTEAGNALASQDTNDLATLHTLADPNFDPAKTVLLSTPLPDMPAAGTNANSGTVTFKDYSTKHIVFDAVATNPSVLLLNDKYDPNWHVSVDGQPAPLLRCNYIMRGVYVPPGTHTVTFDYRLSNKPLYSTLAAIGLGFIMAAMLALFTWGKKTAA